MIRPVRSGLDMVAYNSIQSNSSIQVPPFWHSLMHLVVLWHVTTLTLFSDLTISIPSYVPSVNPSIAPIEQHVGGLQEESRK